MPTEQALTTLSQEVELSAAVEQALTVGDLAKLQPQMRVQYYNAVCLSVGLNPLTRPFDFIKDDSGKLQMYARKECAEQLRKIHRVSVKETAREWLDEHTLCITVTASMPDGREEDEIGAVYLATKEGKPFTGQLRANNVMKCLTKAKRRATLAICGLGFELADEGGRGQDMAFDPQTGEILGEETTPLTIEQHAENITDTHGDPTPDTAAQDLAKQDATPEAQEQRERAKFLADIKQAREDYGIALAPLCAWVDASEERMPCGMSAGLAKAPVATLQVVREHLHMHKADACMVLLGGGHVETETDPEDAAFIAAAQGELPGTDAATARSEEPY